MDTREGNEIGLELVQIHVERTVESQRRSHGGDDLGDEPVKVREAGLLDA